jgi:uncharacterized repeat protein (TIGR04138 family)
MIRGRPEIDALARFSDRNYCESWNAMFDPSLMVRMLERDRRYKLDAYAFVEEALSFAHESLGMGHEQASDEQSPPVPEQGGQQAERHLTGQELCEAIRRYALDEYGYMAKSVLNSWGVMSTRDFGNIVFNLIEIGRMKKTKQDRLEDFDNAYDFDIAFRQQFKIGPLETSSG